MPSSPNQIPQSIPQSKLTGGMKIPAALVEDIRTNVKNLSQLNERLSTVTSENITVFLQTLLVSSLVLDASDAHIEPEADGAKIRLRIDGLLHDIVTLPLATHKTLLSRLKLTAGAKLNVTDRPQDGRFSIAVGNTLIEARVATLPAEYGESVVLRVLNPKNLIAIEELGLRPPILEMLKRELKKPNGMILATGPTGSGKTTTLYAFLKEIENPEIKIITIEDPIEYHLEGISQTQVHPEKGYDFATGLQAIVRQDPDVILVGEIRDKDTAQISLQAALTGHLVFSTLHTNDAPGTVSRLTSLGAKPVNIGAATNAVIGQRLIRKVCASCGTQTKATPEEVALIKKGLVGIKETGVPSVSPSLKLARAQGCQECNGTGYKGRVGLYEFMVMSSAMEELLLKKPAASAVRKFAVDQGMTTLYQDGLLKVMQGITTLEELTRTTGGKGKT